MQSCTLSLGGVPILMAFPSIDNALCPTKEALNQTLGPCLALGSPTDPVWPPVPPHHNLLRCQEEHLFNWWRASTEVLTPNVVYILLCVSQCEYNTPWFWESPCPHNKWCERKKCAARLRSQWSKCPCSPPANHTLWNRVMLTRTNRWGERWENWEELRLNEWKHTEMVIFYHRMLPRVHGWACDRPHCSGKATQCL